MLFTRADYSNLQNYKITKFAVFVWSPGEGGEGGEGGGGVLNLRGERTTKIEQVRTRGDGIQILGIL